MRMSPAAGRRRRRRKTTVDDLPESIIEEILFRLGPYSPDLVRAACAYRPWFRVIADARFHARLATTPHAGDYRTVDGRSLFIPSSPLLDADRFSLDFLPDSDSWELADSRGSVLLLFKKFDWEDPWHDDDCCNCHCFDLIVCDPLRKSYQEIPWPPHEDGPGRFGVYLAEDCAGSHVSMSNFRIIALVQQTIVYAITTGSDGNWRNGNDEFPDDYPESVTPLFLAGRANGFLYWGLEEDNTMVVVLDGATMVLYLALLPVSVWGLSDEETAGRIIGGPEGVLRVVRLIGKYLNVFARRRLGGSNDGYTWVLEKQMWLPQATLGLPGYDESLFKQKFIIIRATTDYVLLSPSDETWVFTVELDAMRVEREHQRNTYAGRVYPYMSPWPPVLSPLSKEQCGIMRRPKCLTKELNNML